MRVKFLEQTRKVHVGVGWDHAMSFMPRWPAVKSAKTFLTATA